jgi:hypothetical protein
MGNSLFQFYFLKQISRELDESVFYTKWRELSDFSETNYRLDEPLSLRRGFKEFGLSDLERNGKEEFLIDCKLALKNKNVLLKPGILGSHFFEFSNNDPRDIIRTKKPIYVSDFDKPYICLHFRGLDFHQWNSKAVMGAKFYEKALLNIMSEVGNLDWPIKLLTDDPDHSEVKKILRISRNVNLVRGMGQSEDFRILAKSKFLVASPSTFAFWGGILGSNKTIFHSKDWLESRADAGDQFWLNLMDREFFYGHNFRKV